MTQVKPYLRKNKSGKISRVRATERKKRDTFLTLLGMAGGTAVASAYLSRRRERAELTKRLAREAEEFRVERAKYWGDKTDALREMFDKRADSTREAVKKLNQIGVAIRRDKIVKKLPEYNAFQQAKTEALLKNKFEQEDLRSQLYKEMDKSSPESRQAIIDKYKPLMVEARNRNLTPYRVARTNLKNKVKGLLNKGEFKSPYFLVDFSRGE